MSVPQDLKWWHGSLIDWMFLNPDKLMRDAARHFNVSESYLSLLTSSDGFKLAYEARRAELTGEVRKTTMDKLKGLADLSIDCLTERIARERDSIALVEVRETMDSVLKAAGFGRQQEEKRSSTTNVAVIITADDLARARELMHQRRRAVEVIDAEPAHPSAAAGL